MSQLSQRDRSRTYNSKTHQLVRKHTKPPDDENGWQWLTSDLLYSPAFRTLSGNAMKAFARLWCENIAHASLHNGKLIVTHPQFIDYGVTGEYVADAIDELQFKGLVRISRGKAGAGTAHPNRYRLTFLGDHEGAKATNDWKQFTMADAKAWSETIRKQMAEARCQTGRKKKSPLRSPEMSPLRNPEIRKAS